MFENSIAFTLSATREGQWRLAEFCEKAGFSKTSSYQNVHVLSQQQGIKLPFCLIDDTSPIETVKETILDIRSCPEIDISFMPIIMLTADTSEKFVGQCIGMGFDDILKLPCRTVEFAQRAKRQMETTHEYFRTEQYFGPDRRRGNAGSHPNRRGGAGFAFEKYSIRRSRRTGIKILSHEKFAADDVMAMFA